MTAQNELNGIRKYLAEKRKTLDKGVIERLEKRRDNLAKFLYPQNWYVYVTDLL